MALEIHEVWISPEVELELGALAGKLRQRLNPERLRLWEAALAQLVTRARTAAVSHRVRLCRDPSDDAYLSLARSVEAEVLVTGDRDLHALSREDLERAGLGRLEIVTPREFVERLR